MSGSDPLMDHVVFHSRDVDEAREQVARIFCPHLLAPVGRGGIDARHHSVRLGNTVSLNYVMYKGDVRIVPGPLETFTVAQVPLTGRAEIVNGVREIESQPGLASVPRPDEHLAMRWDPECGQLIVQADQPALEDDLAAMIDAPLTGPIRWQLGMDVTRGPGAAWWRQVWFTVTEIDRHPEMLDYPLAVAQREHALRVGLLLAQPHNYTRLLQARAAPPSQPEVQQVVDLIWAHPARAWTAASLAREANMSRTALYDGFGRYVGASPMACVEDVRIASARQQLRAAAPGETVTQVAWRTGLTDLARFVEHYHAKYHEHPSQTLHRRR